MKIKSAGNLKLLSLRTTKGSEAIPLTLYTLGLLRLCLAMTTVFCVLSFVGCGGGGSTPVTPTKAYKIADYYPLNEGIIREYNHHESNNLNDIFKQTVSGTKTINGINTIKIVEEGGDETYWALDSEGLRHVGWYSSYSETLYTNSPPIKLASAEFDIGDKWTTETTLTCTGLDCESSSSTETYICEIIGLENVTVTAGTFNNVIKIKYIYTSNTGSITGYFWLAKGIGEVKSEWQSGTEYYGSDELAYAKISGTEYGIPITKLSNRIISNKGGVLSENKNL